MQTNTEIRSITEHLPQIEAREDGTKTRKVFGYSAIFNRFSLPLGWFKEKIAPGAFDEVLDDDTVALFNHNSNMLLARNKKTLKLSIDDIGLRYEFEAPKTTAGNDLLEMIERGDVVGSSFAFTVKSASWEKAPKDDEDGVEEYRTILKVDRLFDVGPVTSPAYPDTTVAKRSRDSFFNEGGGISGNRENEIKKSASARSRHLRLINIK